MQILYSPSYLNGLPLPPSVTATLYHHLTAHFDSPAQAQEFWSLTHTVLWQLDNGEILPDDTLVQVALAYPEYVLYLEDGWYLLLGIVSDDGQGIYLLFPATTCIPGLAEHIREAEHG
ncbi:MULTISPECIES: hypothetical protein [unclassified Tatumella]|uniref:hypothetical protein n=1 Tax=unclassified Tatumella TaxID=2649542 RepID=UPI001BB08DA1|nr:MULTISPECIES: hypothetical protein [unclassified Tatumella]MBS0877146.1 hypothetical protein [Tatumella sp. JGM82]MBS0890586.1 hypothetical protein [Tatumella sp. JGM94]MBS0901449.1 hypothetical protein [Tatumella sp. JGM100]